MKFIQYPVWTLVVLLSSLAFGDDIQKVSLPDEVTQEMQSNPDDEIKGKVWNRWTSENFVVCSLNDNQAKFLNENLESVKTWIYSRWGLPDQKFSAECRLICVDDKDLFKKLFGLTQSKVEVRKDQSGKIKLSVIYLLLDDKPAKTVPIPLTEVCLAEFEQKHSVKFGWWAHRGMANLNGTIDDIRTQILALQPLLRGNKEIFFSKGLLTLKEEEYWRQSQNIRNIYDQCAVCFCLLLRKEYGQDKFLQFINETSNNRVTETSLTIYLYDGFVQFDGTFKRYIFDLAAEVSGSAKKMTPDSYLQINAKP